MQSEPAFQDTKPAFQGTIITPILAGGGTRLAAHVGILYGLRSMGIQFDQLVGVSGGSIVAALYGCGCPLERIKELLMTTGFEQFKGQSLLTLLQHGGLSNGRRFEQWLDQLLEGRCYKDLDYPLHVIATDVSSSCPVVFNRQLTPEVRISRSVRYSMSIPLLFSFETFQDHRLVDGSILSEDALYRQWAGDHTQIICFRLRGSRQRVNPISRWFPLRDLMLMLVQSFMVAVSREYLSERMWYSTLVVDTGSISPIDFSLTPAQKEWLFEAGYRSVQQYLPPKLARKFAAAEADEAERAKNSI